MCGFLGEYSFTNNLSDSESFAHLLSFSKHRGPDSTKIEEGSNYRLGFNRLALLDLSAAGEQPKRSPSQRYHLVFNGEVYNYKELKLKYNLQDLESSSDTQVILCLLDLIGVEETVKELNGMFAIAVIDTRNNKLYLTRDFAGIKPMFYGTTQTGVVFASQFDQIFGHAWIKDNLMLRPEIMKEYFAFGYMQAPNTIYENIFQINPGELIKINRGGEVERTRVFQLNKESAEIADYDLSKIRDAIKKSVKRQLNSDRSLASFLSGGIDSSLVSSYAKQLKDDIEGFTLKVDSKKLDESEFAIDYAKHLNLEHKIIEIEEEELLGIVDEHLAAFSEPFGDYSSIPTYMVTKKAAQFHTAMLSGDGGDEIFWGYPRMYDILEKSSWFKMPLFLRKNLVRITNKIKLTNSHTPFSKNLQEFLMDKQQNVSKRVLDSAFVGGYSKEMNALYNVDDNYTKQSLQQFLRWNEFYGHMQRVLIKVDRASMKNSLEVRVPLLDKQVLEEAWKSFFLIDDLNNLKKPLKELVEEVIPKKLLMNQKKGFSVPIELWFRNQLKDDLIHTVINSDLYGSEHFDQNVLKQYTQDFLDEKHNNGWGVWHIYAWQKWAIKHVLN